MPTDIPTGISNAISLYNTLSRKKETVKPREAGKISLYVCGVTPYDALHIGHARAFLTYDVLRRVLEWQGQQVIHVQNVTDVDDKIIARANQLGVDALELASRFAEEGAQELDQLGCLRAHHYPRVTGNIENIVAMIEVLIEKGFAYAKGGDVYFDVSQDEDYGKLSGQKVEDLQAGARISPGDLKDDPLDFALWKAAKSGEPAWRSPWGDGRPGWHIECSAMALDILGEGFDIHGGARELAFPHHENEVAQSESYLDGRCFAQTWWHCGELRVNGVKMSKSLGNFITLQEGFAKASPQVWRLLFLMTHPQSPLDYSEDKLQQSKTSWARLTNALAEVPETSSDSDAARAFEQRFAETLMDNLNTPEALAAVFDAVSEYNRGGDAVLAGTARRALEVLGFTFETKKVGDELTPRLIELLIQVRHDARERRDFKAGDQIRDELKSLGIILEDSPGGTKWKLEN
jgi:cysteinyl-tRNA synthetase